MKRTWTETGRWRLVALLAGWAGAVAACGGGADPVAERSYQDLPADQVVWELDMDVKEMGTLRARIHADTAYVWEDSARTLMVPVEVELYGANGAQTAHLTADQGELDSNTNKMVARGNVVLVTLGQAQERRLLTEELHYDPRVGRIWSDVHTILFQGETRLEGSGFRANEEMTDLEVFESTGENLEIQF